MTSQGGAGTEARVVVALDASPGSLAALEAAAFMARLLDAELTGVFVQDVNVLRLGEHPAVREMRRFGGQVRRPSRRDMETALDAQAARAKGALERVAKTAGVGFTFQVLKGLVAHELAAVAKTAEVVAVGRVAGTERPGRRIGSTARAVLDRAARPVLFLHPGQRLATPVAVLYDASAGGTRALDLAARLAAGGGVRVLVPRAPDPDSTSKLLVAAGRVAEAHGPRAKVIAIRAASFPVVCDAVHTAGAGFLVTPLPVRFAEDDTVKRLIVDLDVPVLVVPETADGRRSVVRPSEAGRGGA